MVHSRQAPPRAGRVGCGMDILDEIDGIDVSSDEEAVREALQRYARRAIIPLSLLELQRFDFLPRDWDVLERVQRKAEEAREAFGKDLLDVASVVKVGNLLYCKEDFKGAVREYERALGMQPMPAIRKNLGIALMADGRHGEARKVLEEAVAEVTDDADLWFYLGLSWERSTGPRATKDERLEHLNKALEGYDKALEVDPEHGPARYTKAAVLTLLGRKEDAKELITELLRKQPGSEAGWVARGIILRSQEDIEGALKCYDNALKINPDSHFAHLNRSVALFSLGRLEEALGSAEEALNVCKTDIAYSNKGAILSELGRFEESVECFDRALELNPDFEGARRNRDKALMALRKGGKAG